MPTRSINRETLPSAALFAVLVFLPVFYFSSIIVGRELGRQYAFFWSAFAAAAGFAIVYTGRVSFYRRIFFAVSAAAFLLHFKAYLASPALETSCFTETPFCHIALAPAFFTYLYQQYLALMSAGWKVWGPLSLGAAWLFVTLAVGRAWCSWVCFYGGIDDGLSALARRPLLNINRFALKFRDLPAALLVFLLLISLAQMQPSYCLWLCPFKLTGEILDPAPAVRRLQYGLMFFSLAALLLGPLLTKKRTFCSFLCPFAAWQAFWGRVNPFRVSVDAAKCVSCLTCVPACPMTAISCPPGGKPAISAYCNLCGNCMEACPGAGFRYTLFGYTLPAYAAPAAKLLDVKFVFVFCGLVLGAVFSSLWSPAALHDLVVLLGGGNL